MSNDFYNLFDTDLGYVNPANTAYYDFGQGVNPADTAYYDFGAGDVPYNPNIDYGNNSGQFSLGSLLNIIQRQLGGTGYGGQFGSFLASAGIGSLLNRLAGSNTPAPVGYQGGIPQYTIERAQTPIAQQRPAGYRPGQGGITYFAPTKYTPTGKDLGAPTAPATGGTTGGTTGGSNVGVDTGGSVATPGYTGPVTVDGQTIEYASGGAMPSGIAMLAKGRYIQGNGDGVSDSVPAQFVGSKRPAALSDGEFVFPARIVAELGNGSNKAGAKKLYAFMDRVEARAKSAKRGKPSGADKDLSRLA